MAQHGALGPTGGARGVHDERGILLVDGHGHRRRRRPRRSGRRSARCPGRLLPARRAPPRARRRARSPRTARDQRGQALVDDDHRGAAVAQNEPHLVGHQAEVDRHARWRRGATRRRSSRSSRCCSSSARRDDHRDRRPRAANALASAVTRRSTSAKVRALVVADVRGPVGILAGDPAQLFAVRHAARRCHGRGRCDVVARGRVVGSSADGVARRLTVPGRCGTPRARSSCLRIRPTAFFGSSGVTST